MGVDDPERGEYRALALWLSGAPRPPWLARRFQALDLLTAEGRSPMLVTMSRQDPERAWARVLAAAGLEDEPLELAPDPEPVVEVPRRGGHALSPDTPGHRLAVLTGLEAGERPIDLAQRLGLDRDIVDRALRYLARWGAVRSRDGRWWPVREARPW